MLAKLSRRSIRRALRHSSRGKFQPNMACMHRLLHFSPWVVLHRLSGLGVDSPGMDSPGPGVDYTPAAAAEGSNPPVLALVVALAGGSMVDRDLRSLGPTSIGERVKERKVVTSPSCTFYSHGHHMAASTALAHSLRATCWSLHRSDIG